MLFTDRCLLAVNDFVRHDEIPTVLLGQRETSRAITMCLFRFGVRVV